MDTVGWDVYLDVSLLDFNRSEVRQRGQIVIEQGKDLPAETDSVFIEKEKVPYGGLIRISLTAKRSAAITRKILDECTKIPIARWYSYIGSSFNSAQEAIRYIPLIGRPLETVVPDAYQNVRLQYKISVTSKRKLTYRMELIRTSDNICLLVFQGEFLLA